ncbi:MAG: ATP-binding cassette domain-containing protein [Terrimicrobiaceae bacterium]|nr:ATP-binding cassette domain-containing protein [Terrimicrobiaceae bacterium]
MSADVIGIEAVALRDGLVFGRSADADVLLPDPSVSRRHLALRAHPEGWLLEDLGSKSGSYLNGRLFQREPLTYGDIVGVGPFAFRFDGCHLRQALDAAGASVLAIGLTKDAGPARILDGISLSIEPGQFIGVIGPSGAGKSTLLDALCALRPADEGAVFIDGRDLYENTDVLRDEFGYVPQDDIVPLDLSVEQALGYSARLRLPKATPDAVRRRLVAQTINALGLAERARTRVGRLSGGQRKRVSVAAELLSRPRLLFLDEPTSGLDPAAEFALMELLRRLAANGCTIVCTTHVMENAYLVDRLAILRAGRLAFFGPPEEAREHFGVERLTQIYERLRGGDSDAPAWSPSVLAAPSARVDRPLPPSRRPAALPILLRREWATLCADWKNLLLVLGQPILIAVLVTWVSRDASLILFFAYIATLWFGCGNAAQEVVKELPMFRRERLIGLGRHAYLLAKTLSISRITVLQSLLAYGVMQLCAQGIGGSAGWQIAGLVATSFAAVGIGLAISALARSVLQAVMLVPLVLIPQILFSGFTPPAGEMQAGPYAVSRVMPSAAVQSVMDVSLFWGRTIAGAMRVDYPSAFSNLNRDHSLRNGQTFVNSAPASQGLATLVAWSLATYGIAWAALRKRERG